MLSHIENVLICMSWQKYSQFYGGKSMAGTAKTCEPYVVCMTLSKALCWALIFITRILSKATFSSKKAKFKRDKD
jgi:glycerol-3-phosphate acyltransferase PlsY